MTFSGKLLVISVLTKLQDPLGAHMAGDQGQKCHVSAELGGCGRSLTCKREHSAECQLPTIHVQSLNNASQPNKQQVFAHSYMCQVKPFVGQDTAMKENSPHCSCHSAWQGRNEFPQHPAPPIAPR